MKQYFVDLHIHIGRTMDGSPVKITAARDLTLANILDECLYRKGINVIGVVDAGSPKVQSDLIRLVEAGSLAPLDKGGLSYLGKAVLILGAEVETREKSGGKAHFVCFFPTLEKMKNFTSVMAKYIKNINLSSQKAELTAEKLFNIVDGLGGIFVPAHAFTPHKSLFGNCAARLTEVFSQRAIAKIYAIELGLSSDTYLADRLADLAGITFLSNSDAHSLPKIGREYNVIDMQQANYEELLMALKREKGRKVTANYGLDPRLGKYHRTHCLVCERIAGGAPPVLRCEYCGSDKIVKGVLDRLEEIATYREPVSPDHRPPYHYQVPLSFVPGVGRKTVDKLLQCFGTEMEILHSASEEDLEKVAGKKIASLLCLARSGKAELTAGGGGRYGKMFIREE